MTGAPRAAYIGSAELDALGIPQPELPPPAASPRGPRACRVCNALLPRHVDHRHQVTYVVQRDHWVKIGRARTDRLARRLRVLGSAAPGVICPDGMISTSPLILAHTLDGDHEHALHERFSEHHVVGEWFDAEPVLAALAVTA